MATVQELTDDDLEFTRRNIMAVYFAIRDGVLLRNQTPDAKQALENLQHRTGLQALLSAANLIEGYMREIHGNFDPAPVVARPDGGTDRGLPSLWPGTDAADVEKQWTKKYKAADQEHLANPWGT